MSRYIGIDCGLDGAIVCLHDREIRGKVLMPVQSNGRRRELDIAALADLFKPMSAEYVLIIEDPGGHAPSAAGLRSMTYCFAAVKTLAIVHSLRYHTPLARKWQSEYWSRPSKGKFDTKGAALLAAKQFWPQEDWTKSERATKAHDGLIDAALLAEYGRRKNL